MKSMHCIRENVMIWLGVSFFIVAILFSLPIITTDVFGGNITNVTVITKVYVWNTEPTLYDVQISPSPIILNAGNTTLVNCTAYIYDYNGWQDIANGTVNATLYDISNGYNHSSPNDNNYHYTNSSCSLCSEISGSGGKNGTCTCIFAVEYYANNGTWQCNISATDSGGNATEREINLTGGSLTGNANISPVLGIYVPPELDFGNLSVTETSSDITHNVTNWGNIPINVSVRGYGGDNETKYANLSMVCQLGNISIDAERYSVSSGTLYDSMTNLTDTDTMITGFTIQSRTNDSQTVLGEDMNQTFWKLQIPLSVGGYCNGTIVFSANDAS